MTGSSGGQPYPDRKGGLCRREHCSPDAEGGLGDWALRFQSKECDTESWLLVPGSWDCDWRCTNRPWGSFYMLLHDSRQNTVSWHRIDESVQPNETSTGSLECCSQHVTPSNHLFCGRHNPNRHSFRAACWMASNFQHVFRCLPFASSRVPLSGHGLWPLPQCRLARLRKHLWTCHNDATHPPCSSMVHHRQIHIKHTYNILPMPVCTQLHDWIWHIERGFCLVETGLQLHAGTGSSPSSHSHPIRKLPHMNYSLEWVHGEQAWITRLHCTFGTVRASWWSRKSTSGGGQACRSALYGGSWALGGRSRYREYVETRWMLGECGATRVWHWQPSCWHHSEFYLGCDPTAGVACQVGHNRQVSTLDRRTNNIHASRDDVGCYTLVNVQVILLKPVCNACCCYMHRKRCNTSSWRWNFV